MTGRHEGAVAREEAKQSALERFAERMARKPADPKEKTVKLPSPNAVQTGAEARANLVLRALPLLPDAVRRLSDASPGYPGGHEPGGGRRDEEDGDVYLTQPERFGDTMRDRAITDAETLRKALRSLAAAADDIWGVATRWGVRRDARDLEVADPTDEMWCRSCLTIGHMSPRRIQGGDSCGWCYTTLRTLNAARAAAGRKPMDELPRQAIQAHARGDRVYMKDLERWAGVADIRLDRADSRKTRVLASPDRKDVAFEHSEPSGSGSQFRSAVFCGLCGKDLGYAEGDTDATLNAETRRLQVEHTASEHGA
jgi:hypothetical protein